MKVSDTDIPDVKLIEPGIYADARGFFLETWNSKIYKKMGLDASFVQDNLSHSSRGTLRGLHYQVQQTQGKLIQVISGSVFDVAVDLRQSSPTFGKHVTFVLTGRNITQLWVPPGFAHGFLSLEDGTVFSYKCTDFYAPLYERSIRWNDETLAIAWPTHNMTPSLSPKDAAGVSFSDAEKFS